MQQNIGALMERGVHLNELEGRAGIIIYNVYTLEDDFCECISYVTPANSTVVYKQCHTTTMAISCAPIA